MQQGFDAVYLRKAEESLAGAESEFANGRYHNCANRCYYACFQAAIHALLGATIRPRGEGNWGHEFVQAEFVGQLINRRKRYPANLCDVLARTIVLRHTADYTTDLVTETQAIRAVRRTREFVAAVQAGEGEQQ